MKLKVRYGDPGRTINCSEGLFVVADDMTIECTEEQAKFLLNNIPKMFTFVNSDDLKTSTYPPKPEDFEEPSEEEDEDLEDEDVEDEDVDEEEVEEEERDPLSLEGLNAKDSITLVGETNDLELIEKWLVEDERKTVRVALNARKTELTTVEE